MPQFKFERFKVLLANSRKGIFRPTVKPRSDRMQVTQKRISECLKMNLKPPKPHDRLAPCAFCIRMMPSILCSFSLLQCTHNFRKNVHIMFHRWFNRWGKIGALNWKRLEWHMRNGRDRQVSHLKSQWAHKYKHTVRECNP